MAKPVQQPDILVLGDHPSTYLAATLLARSGKLHVAHLVLPGEKLIDRLVMINPALFDLHEQLKPLKRKLDLFPIYGLKFLADQQNVEMAHAAKTISAYVGSLKQVHAEMVKTAKAAGVVLYNPRQFEIERLDETGVQVRVNNITLNPRLLILGGELTGPQKQMIGLPQAWEAAAIHRYTFLRLKGAAWHEVGSRASIVMSLNLRDTHRWGWLLPGQGGVQLAVEQPLTMVNDLSPAALLKHWIGVLVAHGALRASAEKLDLSEAISLDLPLAGALALEAVANRTLCIGPAGGFYSACAEDIYPNCWSAVCAAQVAENALLQRHVQDALAEYRQSWGATLGDYLRGPQQNLRFLLPLVYRNPTMAARLTEAILVGQSVVR